MSHRAWKISSRLFVLGVAAAPLLLFQNCAQNFGLSSMGDASTLGDQLMQKSSFVIDRGTGYTFRLNVPVILQSPDAREVLITQDSDCVPGAGESWQPMSAIAFYPLPTKNRDYRLFVKFRTAPGDLDKAVAIETSCQGAPVTHDDVKPTLSLSADQGPVFAGDRMAFTPNAADDRQLATVLCRLIEPGVPGGREFRCDTPASLTGLGPGAHRIETEAFDAAGNSSGVQELKFLVDRQAPNISFQAPTEGQIIRSASVNVKFTVTDNDTESAPTSSCRLERADGSSVRGWGSCPGGVYGLSGLANGVYRAVVRATDRAGNVSAESPRTFTIDVAAGAFNIAGVTDATGAVATAPSVWLAGSLQPRIHWTAASGAVQYEVRVFDGTDEICSAVGLSTTDHSFGTACGLVDGKSYRVRAWAVNNLGTRTEAESELTFTVDTQAPLASVDFFENNWANARVRMKADVGPSAVTQLRCLHEWSSDGTTFLSLSEQDCASTVTYQGLEHRAGQHRLRVRTADAAGNQRLEVRHSYTVWSTDCAQIPGPLNECPLVFETFDRAAGAGLLDANPQFPWRHLVDANGASQPLFGAIFRDPDFKAWPALTPNAGLVLAGYQNKVAYAVTKEFALAGYQRVIVRMNIATLGLESGEGIYLEVCGAGADACGAGTTTDAAKLGDPALWKVVTELPKSTNASLNGQNLAASDFTDLDVNVDFGGVSPDRAVFRLRYQWSGGFSTINAGQPAPGPVDDGAMIDNFRILVDRP